MKKYILNADLIRVSALFAVVGIHLLTPIYARPDFFGGKFWWITFLLNCLFRASVPLFIMLSGYLVLPKPITVKENVQRAWKRIIFPLLSFYTLLHLFNWYAAGARGELYDPLTIFHNLSKNTYSYLYFLVILAFLYLLVPLFQLIFESKEKNVVKYLILFFLGNAAIATIARYVSLREGDVFHTFTTWILFVGYFLYGYYVRIHKDREWLHDKVNWLVAVGGYLSTVLLGFWSYQQHSVGNDVFYIGGVSYPEEYTSIGVMMLSISLFNILITWKPSTGLTNNRGFTNMLKWFAMISFGVYLVHPLVMDFLNKFCGITADSPYMPNLVVYVLVNTVLTFVISIGLSALLNLTPYLRRIVGRET